MKFENVSLRLVSAGWPVERVVLPSARSTNLRSGALHRCGGAFLQGEVGSNTSPTLFVVGRP